jgi:ATP/maltotriose-dependent transcriptional regulator MalT
VAAPLRRSNVDTDQIVPAEFLKRVSRTGFCDGCFAIGESQKDSKLRYLKQIKVRQSEFKFDNNNVALCQIDKPSNFLGFELLDFSSEREHLKEITDRDINQRNSQILELHSQGLANTKIAEMVGLTEGGVRGILKKIKK